MAKTARIAVRLEESDKSLLEQIAYKDDRNISTYVALLIKKHLKKITASKSSK